MKTLVPKTYKSRRARRIGKDAPFPVRTKRKRGKDGPFPLNAESLHWERVSFDTVYQGSRGPKKSIEAVIHSTSELAAKFPDFASAGINPQNINFTEEELIIVGLGERPDNGYMVQVDEIFYFTDRMKARGPLTSVTYSEHKTNGMLDVITYPVHVVKLRKLDGTEAQFTKS